MQNQRNTKQKQHILNILSTAKRPMSINEIYNCCIECYPKIAKSTIYRTIDSLLKQDLIDKYFLSDNEMFYQIKNNTTGHKHYVICNCCKKIFDLPYCPIHDIQDSLNAYGFSVTDHYIQISGICNECKTHTHKCVDSISDTDN
ncbi:MAG: transcriptional repressor [bacterium]|nr:transcriptional repressor [bacterium]